MKKYLGNYSSEIYAILRIVAGFMFLMHGTQKLFGWPGDGETVELFSQLGLAGVIELVAGILIMIGLFTSLAAFIASGEMAAAFFIAHAPQGWNPLMNGGEKAVLYCFLFLSIAAYGAGIWSIDASKKKNNDAPAL